MKKEVFKECCDILLSPMMTGDLLQCWWNRKTSEFGGRTPLEVFDSDPEGMYNYLVSAIQKMIGD